MFDPSKYSDEELLAEYQRAKGAKQPQPTVATRPQGTIITDLLDKINPKLTNSLIGAAEGFTGKTTGYKSPLDQQYKLEQIKALQNRQQNYIPIIDEQGNVTGYREAPTGNIKFQPVGSMATSQENKQAQTAVANATVPLREAQTDKTKVETQYLPEKTQAQINKLMAEGQLTKAAADMLLGNVPDGAQTGASGDSNSQGEPGMVMTSARVGGIGLESPEGVRKMAQVKAEADASAQQVGAASKLGTAVKRLKLLNKQFGEALPSGENSPATQRVMGPLQVLGAKTGLFPNAQLNAIKKNARPIGIQLIRAFGEVGNLSGPEQASAIDIVNQEGLTDDERMAAVRQFAEFALAGASKEGLEYLRKDPDIQGIIKEFGITFPGDETGGSEDPSDTASQLEEVNRQLEALGG